MQLFKQPSIARFIVQLLFLLLPTSWIVTFILWNSNQYFTIMREQWFSHAVYFSLGMLLAFFLAQFRFRFLPLFALLVFAFFSIYQLLDHYAMGEFDSFFVSVRFLVFAWLFSAGWLAGWGLQRIRYFPIVLSAILLMVCIFLIAKTGKLSSPEHLLQYLTPVVLYAVYIVYTHEALRNTEIATRSFWLRFTGRLLAFSAMLFLLFGTVVYLMYPEIKERVEEYGGGGKEGENQMLKTNKDGTVENNQSMGMESNNKRDKNPEPLFCAHIDSYLPGTEIPNPLYLTSYHFTRFDTLTETFERDSTNRFSDEFQPDMRKVPLFSTYQDSTRIQLAKGSKRRKTVEIEVYKKRLSASAFLGPSTAWWVQPITVEREFQKEFSSAYRSKSYVSELNSAYFIYNTDQPEIVEFQKQRFSELRKAKNYSGVDEQFLNYHTFFPSSLQYRRIKMLADNLAKGKTTTIDKVLAVRDHFLQRDELGKKIFSYSDNPGVPGLPSSSKLMYFLFESKKGYCAYYAGATVFILRAMGIPSRIVTGFLTVDRSDKNTGWYWFYEDQSHGWVQVYFPEYGWIDFDTTVGNDEAQQSPTPDGTPPLQPPKPVLAAAGQLVSVDTISKTAQLMMSNLFFREKEYKNLREKVGLDLKRATIWKDSVQLTIQNLSKGDYVMAVSYAERLKAYVPGKDAKTTLDKLPSPLPIDEIYIKSLESLTEKPEKKEEEKSRPLSDYLRFAFISLIILFILILLVPTMVYRWYKYKSKKAGSPGLRAYYTYRASTLLLHQLGVDRGMMTPWQFARQKVDPYFGTRFTSFMNVYLKIKYADTQPSAEEAQKLDGFFEPFERQIKSAFKPARRVARFLNLNTFINYYSLPEPETNV